jgi:hypothetical protein
MKYAMSKVRDIKIMAHHTCEVFSSSQAREAYLLGQLAGSMVNLRLTRAIRNHAPIQTNSLLPELNDKSGAYKMGLKNFILNNTFPLVLQLFHRSARSHQERIRFMNTLLNQLR